jgi:hypothetical protein
MKENLSGVNIPLMQEDVIDGKTVAPFLMGSDYQ